MSAISDKPILVTGGSGSAGKQVVRALRNASIPVKLATRSPDQISGKEGIQPVYFDFFDADTFPDALGRCHGLFLLRPPAISKVEETLNPLVDAARLAGIKHIQFLSVAGAADYSFVPHAKVEKHLKAGPKDWTILRPGFFAQNFETEYRDELLENRRLFLPAGDGEVAFIDLRDLGDATARIFQQGSSHLGKTYTLTGPQTFTFHEAAAILTDLMGQNITYKPASVPGYLIHLLRSGTGWGKAVVQTVLHTGLRYGQASTVEPALELLIDREPCDLEKYLRDHRSIWLGE